MSQAQLIPTASPSPIFSFKSHQIRTIMQGDNPWFVAKDVCAALGVKWNGKFLSNIPDDWQGVRKLLTPSRGGNQNVRIISEPAVYKLAFRSNKPEADAFTNWVACEVLPAIRKTGKFEAKPKRTPKALPVTPQPHLFDRLRLTPWDKVQMGKRVRQMLDSEDVGQHTMECVLLKARYVAAIDDVYRLCNQLHTDLRKAVRSPYAAARQKVNTAGNVWTDSLTDSMYADHYRIMELGKEFHSVAHRALNAGICVSRMLAM